jgi:hypothetical protein
MNWPPLLVFGSGFTKRLMSLISLLRRSKKEKRDPPVAFESSPIPVDSLAMVGGKNPLRFEPVIHSLRPGAGNSKSIHLDGSLPTSLPKKLPTTCHTIKG